MSTIGTFTHDGKGIFQGHIRTPFFYAEITILSADKKSREKSPDFKVFSLDCECGAAWLKATKDGREYLSVQIDDPMLPAPINARLVKTGIETHSLIWERPRPSYQKVAA